MTNKHGNTHLWVVSSLLPNQCPGRLTEHGIQTGVHTHLTRSTSSPPTYWMRRQEFHVLFCNLMAWLRHNIQNKTSCAIPSFEHVSAHLWGIFSTTDHPFIINWTEMLRHYESAVNRNRNLRKTWLALTAIWVLPFVRTICHYEMYGRVKPKTTVKPVNKDCTIWIIN